MSGSSSYPGNDADSDSRSSSSLLSSNASCPAVVGPSFGQPAAGTDQFMSQQNRPSEFLVLQQPIFFTFPVFLCPAFYSYSPWFITSTQGQHIQSENPPSSAAPPASSLRSVGLQHKVPTPMPDHVITIKTINSAYEEPANDGFNWDWYTQRQVKGCSYPRTYYKCRHVDCPVQEQQIGNIPDQESGQFTHEYVFESSEGELVEEEAEAPVDRSDEDEDEPESKKRRSEVQAYEKEPRIIVLKESEDEDILDDGYKWRNFGKKAIKKTNQPRKYFKCANYQGCNGRKQVDRAVDNEKVVRTQHNYEVPASRRRSRSTAKC